MAHSSQCIPFAGAMETIALPYAKIPRTYIKGLIADTGLSIPQNHALVIVSGYPLVLTLQNPGDEDIVLPLPAGARRIIVIKAIAKVAVNADGGWTAWIEDLRSLANWDCNGANRP